MHCIVQDFHVIVRKQLAPSFYKLFTIDQG